MSRPHAPLARPRLALRGPFSNVPKSVFVRTHSAYGSAPMLNWLVQEKRITPHIPVITLLYRGSTRDCVPCPLKPRCCPNTPVRTIPRSIYERARDVVTSKSLAN